MADSTRRSGRATKGQHSRALEPEDAQPTPPKRGGKAAKGKKNEPTPPPEEDDAIIRCICGYVVEDEDDDRKMICCEQCEAWQHNECMEVSENDDELPDKYYCEQCRPKEHKELLAKIARGEKPWEERARQRELEEQDKKGRKRKGRRGGKRGRPSEVQKETVQENGAMDTTMTTEPDTTEIEQNNDIMQTPPQPEGNNKRKLVEDTPTEPKSPSQTEPASKLRKVSIPVTTEKPPAPPPSRRKSNGPAANSRESTGMILQAELVESIDDLQSDDRKKIATALVRHLVDLTKQAEKQGSFNLPAGQDVKDFGTKLGLAVEYAIYLNFWGGSGRPSDLYKDKYRAISHNVKHNNDLRDRLLTGSLSPYDLSKMSREDMASKELREEKAKLMKESEKQHVLIQEEGPRMRRTHKGEELIEDDSHIVAGTESSFTAPVRKRPSEIDDTVAKQESPEAATPRSPTTVELPDTFHAGSPTPNQPLVIDTNAASRPSAIPERKPSNNFNIQDVWSGVKGPDPEQRPRHVSRPSDSAITPIQQTSGPGVQSDPEIDQLLKDEDPEDEEPYSPVEYTAEPGSAIWHGKMAMAGIASFDGTAKHVAGADLSSNLPWGRLIPNTLTIEGRIDIDRASEYLCGLRWSNTTDVVVVSVTPNDEPDNIAQFDKLFRYFTERKRYGVIGKSLTPAVKDTYVVPLDVGMSKKPEFVELLEYCIIEDPTSERMLLLTFVVKSNNSPSAQQTPRHLDASSLASPIGANGPNGPNSIGQNPAFQNSPTPAVPFNPQSHLPAQHGYVPPPTQQQLPPYPPYPQQQLSDHGAAATGMEAARQVLGDMANAPVVSQLLAEAPDSRVPEFTVVRELFHNSPACQNDLGLLKKLLATKHQQAQEQHGQH